MFCYKCGCELDSGPKCPNCSTDVQQYKKIIYTSNYLYNEGLAKAQVKDLSGAIIALKDAIWYNKSNLDARNLLGLCYYEIGETVAALSEWIIAKNINDSGLQNKSNLADHYIAEVQNGKQTLDNMNTAIQRYNHALDCCKTDNLDVAVLQLRKVLNLNSHYLRARQLLALVYMEQQQWSKAQKELRKCLLLDINNTTTLRYLQEVESRLSPEAGSEESVRKRKKSGGASGMAAARAGLGKGGARKKNVRGEGGVIKYTADNETIIQPAGTRIPGVDGFGVPGAAIGGIIGLVIGAAVIMFLVMPTRLSKVRSDAADQVREVSAQMDSKEAEIADLTSQIEALNTSEPSTGDANTGDDAQVDALLAAANAYLADSSNEDGSVTTAFAAIDHQKVSGLSDSYQALYNTIKNAIGSDMLDYYYLAGAQAYEAASPDYESTITNLENALLFDSDTSPSAAHAQILYYLGDSYYRGYLQSLTADAEQAGTSTTQDAEEGTTETSAEGSSAGGEDGEAATETASSAASREDYIVKAETYLGQVVNDYADSSYAARAWSDINAIAADADLAALAGDALIEANTDAAATTADSVDSTVNAADASTSATTVRPDTTAAAGQGTTSAATQDTTPATTPATGQETTQGTAAAETVDTSAQDAEALAAATAAAQAAYAAAISSGASEADAMAAANAALGQ